LNLFVAQHPQRPTDEAGYRIGLGWRIDEQETRLKSGSGDGFESIMFFNRDEDCRLGLVVLSNSYIASPNDTTTTGTDIFNELLRHYKCRSSEDL